MTTTLTTTKAAATPPQLQKPYLPHLDGIRAIAVLAVLLFHFEVQGFRAGYVGVDIFLSLSGYLITRNILHDVRNARFSLSSFYTRRFFRLYPSAICTVLLAVAPAFLIMSADLLLRTAYSALASLFFSSNVYFNVRHNYWDEASNLKPLLHMWSLSLEEQFYLFWPPFLLFLTNTRSPNTRLYTFATFALLSFVFATVANRHHPFVAFYELPCRMFQFILGAMLAMYHSSQLDDHKLHSNNRLATFFNITGVLAVLTVLASASFLPPGAPPLLMLPISLSTVAMIMQPPTSPTHKFLSLSFMRTVGRYSYAVYLVHWPVFVILRYVTSATRTTLAVSVLFGVTAIFAFMLHSFIEQPLRAPKRGSAIITALLFLMTLAFCAMIAVNDGFPKNKVDERWVPMFRTIHEGIRNEIHRDTLDKSIIVKRVGQQNGTHSGLYLFGNSYVGMYAPALSIIGQTYGVYFNLILKVSFGLFTPDHAQYIKPKETRRVLGSVWEFVRSLPKGSVIGMSPTFYANRKGMKAAIVGNTSKLLRELEYRPLMLANPPGLDMEAGSYFTCHALWQRPLGVVLSKVGAFSGSEAIETCMGGPLERGYRTYRADGVATEVELKRICQQHGVWYTDLFGELCDGLATATDFEEVRCRVPTYPMMSDTGPGYLRDRHHISPRGSVCLAPFLEKQLQQFGVLGGNSSAIRDVFSDYAQPATPLDFDT